MISFVHFSIIFEATNDKVTMRILLSIFELVFLRRLMHLVPLYVVATVINYHAINRWTVATQARDRHCQTIYTLHSYSIVFYRTVCHGSLCTAVYMHLCAYTINNTVVWCGLADSREKRKFEEARVRTRFGIPRSVDATCPLEQFPESLNLKSGNVGPAKSSKRCFFSFALAGEAKFPPPGPGEWIISSWLIARSSKSRKRSFRNLIVIIRLISRSDSSSVATLGAHRRWSSLPQIRLRWFRLGGGRLLLRLQEDERRRLRLQVALLRFYNQKLDLVAVAARERLGD